MLKIAFALCFSIAASVQCAISITTCALANGDVYPHLHMASPPGNLPRPPRSLHFDSTSLSLSLAFGFLLSWLLLTLLASRSTCSRWLLAVLSVASLAAFNGVFPLAVLKDALVLSPSALAFAPCLAAVLYAAYALAPHAIAALRFLCSLAVLALHFLALALLNCIRLLADFCFAPCTFILCVLSYSAMTFCFFTVAIFGFSLQSWLGRACTHAYSLYAAASNRLSFSRGVAYRLRLLRSLSSASSILRLLVFFAFTLHVYATDDASTSKPPLFDGTRANFVSWLMVFTAWIAWKQTDVVGVMEGTIARPVEPVEPVEPLDPATLASTDPNLAAATALHHAWTADHAAWVANHSAWAKEMVVYSDLNTKLYGAILQAVPEYLRTGLYLTHRNDGYAVLESLRNQFDAVDANDHASHMARLQGRYIDGKNDISENDLRRQYDNMMTACAGIIRTKNAVPNQAALIAMFDNALPIAYSQIRQLVRRSQHATFMAHYEDYMAQVRAELSARAPTVSAFSASALDASNSTSSGGGTHDRERTNRRNGNGNGSNLCLRCAKAGHSRPKCKKSKKTCKHCGADHSSRLCPKGPGGPLRDSLSDAARRLLDADVSRMAKSSSSDSDSDSGKDAATPPVTTGTPVPKDIAASSSAHLAASTAAAACDTPEAAGQAYITALKALGF